MNGVVQRESCSPAAQRSPLPQPLILRRSLIIAVRAARQGAQDSFGWNVKVFPRECAETLTAHQSVSGTFKILGFCAYFILL